MRLLFACLLFFFFHSFVLISLFLIFFSFCITYLLSLYLLCIIFLSSFFLCNQFEVEPTDLFGGWPEKEHEIFVKIIRRAREVGSRKDLKAQVLISFSYVFFFPPPTHAHLPPSLMYRPLLLYLTYVLISL